MRRKSTLNRLNKRAQNVRSSTIVRYNAFYTNVNIKKKKF